MPDSRYPDGPRESPGFLLWRLTLSWQRAVSAVLEPLGLTHTQFVLLACTYWLDTHGEATSQVAISDASNVDPKTTSAVLRKLETMGLVTRRSAQEDSRVKIVVPTAVGADLARQALQVVETADEAFFAQHPESLRLALLGVRMPDTA
jgi:DNA-binding MarR family transcriptional regulator